MKKNGLGRLTNNVRALFGEFKTIDLKDINPGKVQGLIDLHKVAVEDIRNGYSEKPH